MTHCMGNLLEEPEFSARASEGRHCAENKKTATQEGSFQFAISQRSQEIQGAPRAAHRQPGDHAHTAMHSRQRPPPAERRAAPPLAPRSSGRPASQAAHPQCAPGCVAHTHTHSGPPLVAGERHRSYRTATRHTHGARSAAAATRGVSLATRMPSPIAWRTQLRRTPARDTLSRTFLEPPRGGCAERRLNTFGGVSLFLLHAHRGMPLNESGKWNVGSLFVATRRSQMIYLCLVASVLGQTFPDGAVIELTGQTPTLIYGQLDASDSLTLTRNASDDKLVCSGEFEAADLRITGTSTTVADLIQEVAALRQDMAAVKAFVGMSMPPSSPLPPSSPPSSPLIYMEVNGIRFVRAWRGYSPPSRAPSTSEVGGMNEDMFNTYAAAAPNGLLIRDCQGCGHSGQLVYKRSTPWSNGTYDAFDLMLSCWRLGSGNLPHIDFEVFSSVSDALSNTAPWTYLDGDDCLDDSQVEPGVWVACCRNSGPSGIVNQNWITMRQHNAAHDNHVRGWYDFWIEVVD